VALWSGRLFQKSSLMAGKDEQNPTSRSSAIISVTRNDPHRAFAPCAGGVQGPDAEFLDAKLALEEGKLLHLVSRPREGDASLVGIWAGACGKQAGDRN
jgi:hypothetical protein